jgi:D-serine deaminase-like pyridoxal phosphate-dependent protein
MPLRILGSILRRNQLADDHSPNPVTVIQSFPAVLAAETPAVVIDSARMDANIARMAAVARNAGVNLRPHAKSHKIPAVARRQLEAGAVGLTVAKVGEAEVFVDAGIDDILIAYPVWGDSKWTRVCDLAAVARIAVTVDSVEAIDGLAAVADARGLTIPVRIELDTGFQRCGVPDIAAAIDLARVIEESAGVRLEGVMSFAGHSYGAGSARVEEIGRADAELLAEAARALIVSGFGVDVVSVGGTPTAESAGSTPGVTEIRPGTYVFSDRDQVALGWGTLDDCALTVITTVVSRPAPDRAIIDAGTKAFSSDLASQAEGWGVVLDHPEARITGLTEEHGIVEVPVGSSIRIGSVLRVIPNHACGTLNMHDTVLVSEGGNIVDQWEVAARAKLQ